MWRKYNFFKKSIDILEQICYNMCIIEMEVIYMNENIKKQIEGCNSKKQVLDILNKNKIQYRLDNEMIKTLIDNGCAKTKALDLWVDEVIRIYYSKLDKCYVVQKWNKYKRVYTGNKRVIPTCYGNTTEIDDYVDIKVK